MFSEPLDEAWRRRYGASAPEIDFDPGRFLNHRSVRSFLPVPVPESTARYLVGCAQSAACSSHLQLGSIISVQDPERRAQINECCHNQQHIADAAWFFAFTLDVYRLRQMALSHGASAPATDAAEYLILGSIDTALMGERMVCAAEAMGLGTCYIGALRNETEKVSEILALPEGVMGLFGLCIGVPDPAHFPPIKPRLGQETVWFREQYGVPDWHEFDERMGEEFRNTGQNPEYTWSARTARRGEDSYMGGRIKIRETLRRNRLDLR